MPGQTAAVHGVRCSGRTFAQYFPLRNGIFPHVPEISGQSGNGEIFAALLFLGAEAWRLIRPWIMEGLPFLRVLLLHAASSLWAGRLFREGFPGRL